MFKFCSLYSGSSGNSSLIQTENTKILVDVGESAKKIADALNSINIEPTQIDAILITHEHSDHTKGISTFSKKYNIPVYANKETWNSLKQHKEKLTEENIKYFTFNKFNIGDLSIVPFSIPHDASNPCGFNVYHKDKKISIATDIGHMTSEIVENLTNSSFVLLESNYDLEVLKSAQLLHGLNTVMLGHLSKENNFPELAYKTVVEHLIKNNINNDNFKLSVADRYNVSPIIDIG